MRRSLIVLLVGGMCSGAMGQVLDPAPPLVLGCGGTLPVTTIVRIELLTTPAAGGVPAAVSVFDTVVPPGPTATWCAPLLAAIAADPAIVAGPIAGGVTMPISAAAGTRLALRAISTTTAALPALPTMPPLTAGAAGPWPPAPLQPVGALGANYDYYVAPAAPVGIIGAHFLALPPDRGGVRASDDPVLTLQNPIPTVSEWGLVIMTVLMLTAGTVILGRRRRTAVA